MESIEQTWAFSHRRLMSSVLVGTQTDWVSYSPEAGVIPPGSSQDIEVQFSAVDIEGGTYSTNIQILSNDEDQPELLIPV